MAQHITVVEYKKEWRELFKQEKLLITNILQDNLVSIHHIGSTAVYGLKSKPIIDIMPVVKDISKVDIICSEFKKIGYEYLGEYGIPYRRYLRKGGDKRTHQIHIFEQSNKKDIIRHIAVRDYLRINNEIANVYGELKESLAKKFPYDIDKYCDGKDVFMKKLEITALKWKNSL